MNFKLRSPISGIDLYLEDSINVMKHLQASAPLGIADFIITDPPYGIGYVGDVHAPIANDKKPPIEFVAPMAELLKANTAMLLFSRWDVAPVWMKAMGSAGLDVQKPIIWHKIYRTRIPLEYEMILVGYKGTPPLRPWTDEGRFTPLRPDHIRDHSFDGPGTIWIEPSPRDKLSQRHPTPKPSRLMERALLNYTSAGDLVLDPFMGGSPVGVAAVKLGRRYIGIELEAKNYRIAVDNVQREITHKQVIAQARAAVAD